jgi:hypothetical protein
MRTFLSHVADAGTLRYRGFCSILDGLARLGLLADAALPTVPNTAPPTNWVRVREQRATRSSALTCWFVPLAQAEVLRLLLRAPAGQPLEEAVMAKLCQMAVSFRARCKAEVGRAALRARNRRILVVRRKQGTEAPLPAALTPEGIDRVLDAVRWLGLTSPSDGIARDNEAPVCAAAVWQRESRGMTRGSLVCVRRRLSSICCARSCRRSSSTRR